MTKRLVSEYKIVTNVSYMELEGSVKMFIKSGWQPFGGICFNTNNYLYLQTMVKYDG